jgi:hypothetical protein
VRGGCQRKKGISIEVLTKHQWGQTILKPLSCTAGDWFPNNDLVEATDDEQWAAYIKHLSKVTQKERLGDTPLTKVRGFFHS